METITINIKRSDVYEEVAKATDYTGSKLIYGDENARERILAADDDLAELGRFWEESASAVNENFKEMLVSWADKVPNVLVINSTEKEEAKALSPEKAQEPGHSMTLEVSKSFDTNLTTSIQSTLRSFFIASIIGYWFKFANKGEAKDYFEQAAELLATAERMLYSRKKPSIPKD